MGDSFFFTLQIAANNILTIILMKSHSFLCLLLAGVSCAAFFSGACANELPSTLKPQVNERAVYDWNGRHKAVMERNRSVNPEYAVFGDSITHRWGGEPSGDNRALGTGKEAWKNLFSPHTVTNMGFGSDYVDNAYYRVQLGELDGISPRVIIVLLGTNNLGGRKDTPRACADNLKAFVSLVGRKCPASKILLLGILPRKEKAVAPLIVETNKMISVLADGKRVFFANPGTAFLAEDGVSPKSGLLVDGLHPSATGYDVLGKELSSILEKIDGRYKGGSVVR